MAESVRTAPPAQVDVAVLGGGIGGLAAAVALRRAGVDVHVFERTAVLAEVGGAVLIREPSVRLFEAWGLGEPFHAQGVPVELLELLDGAGTHVRTSTMDFIGDGKTWSCHRADVHDLLRAALPADRIHLGVTATAVHNEADGEHATATFRDGTQVTARLLVGADGIRSVVRAAVVPDEPVEPEFQGAVVTRGLSPASALPPHLPNDRVHIWAQGHRMILALPLRGGTLVAVDTILQADLPPRELWTATIPTQELLDRFADFDPALLHLIAAGVAPVRANPVYDREPIETWADGRIVLLGDAAHPMAPRQGQGANQAVQDAGALADAVARHGLDDPADALRSYQDARVGPATTLQRASRQQPEQFKPAASGAH